MKRTLRYSTLVYLAMVGFIVGFATPLQAKAKAITLIFSTYLPPTYEFIHLPIVHFAERVEKETNGRVKIKIFHSAQLFKGKEEFAALERGDIDMSNLTDVYHQGIVPDIGISGMPFIWKDASSLQKTIQAGLWDQGIKDKLQEHNMVVLGVAPFGGTQFYSKGFSVHSPKDVQGKKWGVSGSTESRAVRLMGGAPTTMSSGELYIALQRGVIDGTTRPLITGVGRKLWEVVDNLTITNMGYGCSILVINKKKWDSLPGDIQEIFKKAGMERDKEYNKRLNVFMKEGIKKYRDNGVEVYFPTDEELEEFKEVVSPIFDWWTSEVPNGKKYIEFSLKHR